MLHAFLLAADCTAVSVVPVQVVIAEDDGIRPGTTPASLAGLKTVFKKDGTTTAGNSSQVGVSVLAHKW